MISLEAFIVVSLLLMFLAFPIILFNLCNFFMILGFFKDDVQKSKEREAKLLSEYKF